MLIIGERINSSRPDIKDAIARRDAQYLIDEAARQAEAGASYIDVNCGTSLTKETEDMKWLISTIQGALDVRLCIDSPNPSVISEALAIHKGQAIVNSVTAEKARYEKVLPFCKDTDALIVALTMDEKGVPHTAKQRFENATIIMEICQEYGIAKERLLFDPLIRPVSAEQGQAQEILEAIRMIKEIGLKTVAGVSNISYGLPARRLINRTFLCMAYAYGLDACIIDPLDHGLMSVVSASRAILGDDAYSMGYINAYREKKLVS